MFYEKYIKRFIDISASLIGIIVLLPIYIVVSILVKINLGSPIIFKQKRPGKDEKIFEMYKFRTMTDKRDSEGKLLSDKERLTSFGLVLRKTSLDEIPGLFNVLKGEMSLVGPRPLSIKYLPYYNENEKKRHNVRPGITGLAQVNGRNSLNWDKRFEHDIYYVNNITLIMDFKILLKTVKKVIIRDGITIKEEEELLDFDIYRRKSKENV